MNVITRNLVPAAIAAITIVGVTAVRAADWDSRGEKNTYVVTALVSDLAGKAKFQCCRIRGASPFRPPVVLFGSPTTPLVVRRSMTERG